MQRVVYANFNEIFTGFLPTVRLYLCVCCVSVCALCKSTICAWSWARKQLRVWGVWEKLVSRPAAAKKPFQTHRSVCVDYCGHLSSNCVRSSPHLRDERIGSLRSVCFVNSTGAQVNSECVRHTHLRDFKVGGGEWLSCRNAGSLEQNSTIWSSARGAGVAF